MRSLRRRHLHGGRWLALAAACALAALGCGSADRPPNVLLVVLDTLRADRLGAYGSTRNLTPFLDELAKRGVVFESTYAVSSWTSPSVASLFTARYPLQHGIVDFESVLAASEATLAESLHELGFATGGFSANFRIAQRLGYAQGFDVWREYLAAYVNPDGGRKVSASHVRREALAWLDGVWNPEAPRPVLLYLQFMEPHSPYVPPEDLRRRLAPEASQAQVDAANALIVGLRFGDLSDEQVALLSALYDGEVAALDAELRTLFSALEERSFLDHAIVVVVSDHGEEFREHGMLLHGITLYEQSVRVPLLILGPGTERGLRVAEPVSLLDLAPTVLELLGAPLPETFEGHSLLPALRGEQRPNGAADILLELARKPDVKEVRTHAHGLVRGSRKLLIDPEGRARLFDLARDPGEQGGGEAEGEARAFATALERARAELGSRASAPAPRLPLDEKAREDLRALGYLRDPDPAPGAAPRATGQPAP